MADDRPLAGRTAIITGGSRGIGLACARAVVQAGARVWLVARGAASLDRAVAEMGSAACGVACDLSLPDDLLRCTSVIRDAIGGPPDVIVNNAARFAPMPVRRMSVDEFELTIRTNLIPYFALVRAFLDDFLTRGHGHVVHVGSIADRVAYPDNAAYSASKFGVRGLHEVLRLELRGTGVRSSLVSPASVDTGIWDSVDPATRAGHTPRERMLDAESVAEAVLFAITRPARANVDELRLSRS